MTLKDIKQTQDSAVSPVSVQRNDTGKITKNLCRVLVMRII